MINILKPALTIEEEQNELRNSINKVTSKYIDMEITHKTLNAICLDLENNCPKELARLYVSEHIFGKR